MLGINPMLETLQKREDMLKSADPVAKSYAMGDLLHLQAAIIRDLSFRVNSLEETVSHLRHAPVPAHPPVIT